MEQKTYHEKLKQKMDQYAHLVYKATKHFPQDEIYGVTSQLRRSALSVILNYIEGYARQKDKVHRHFLEISYGSLQESKYLLEFSFKERYLLEKDYQLIIDLSNEIGAMLWGVMKKMSA